jgi:hypothetical protein
MQTNQPVGFWGSPWFGKRPRTHETHETHESDDEEAVFWEEHRKTWRRLGTSMNQPWRPQWTYASSDEGFSVRSKFCSCIYRSFLRHWECNVYLRSIRIYTYYTKKQYKPSRCQNRLHLAMADFMIFGGFKTHASLFEHRRPPGPLLINQHYCSSTGGKAHSEGWMMTWSCHFGQSPRKIDFLIGTTKLQFSEDDKHQDKHQDRPYTVYTMYTVYTLCIPPCGNSSLGHLQAPALCMAHHTWHPVGESGAARFGSTSTMDQ